MVAAKAAAGAGRGGGAAARPERTNPLQATGLSSPRPAKGPQHGAARPARGLRPREVWRQGPRDCEELRHLCPLSPARKPRCNRARSPERPEKGREGGEQPAGAGTGGGEGAGGEGGARASAATAAGEGEGEG